MYGAPTPRTLVGELFIARIVVYFDLTLAVFTTLFFVALAYQEPLPYSWLGRGINNSTRAIPCIALYVMFFSIPYHPWLWINFSRFLPKPKLWHDREMARHVSVMGLGIGFFMILGLAVEVLGQQFQPRWVHESILISTAVIVLVTFSYLILTVLWVLETPRAARTPAGGAAPASGI